MIYVGIDVSKDKHDCAILASDGKILNIFTVQNNLDGFEFLLKQIRSASSDLNNVKVGLEATGHYSYNILGFLLDKGLSSLVFNPLRTNLFRKSNSLRLTKTDRIDARSIAAMLMSDSALPSYPASSYHNDDLKSLSRYRFTKVQERAKLKSSLSRLVNIIFPELESLVSSLHSVSVYALLDEYPDPRKIASAHLTHLSNLLSSSSRGRYSSSKATEIRNAARRSIGSCIPARSLELRHTIQLIRALDDQISQIESEIKKILSELAPPILSVPGISFHMAGLILGEIGDLSRFSSPDKLLAFSGLSPSLHQSGKKNNSYSHMEKRGSRYLRYAIFNAAKFVCHWNPVFADYLAKKINEGKHYFVALSHAAKKLVRLIFALQRSGRSYSPDLCLSRSSVPSVPDVPPVSPVTFVATVTS